MYCSKCGREVPDNANFCKYCGYDFSLDDEKSTLASTEDTEQTAIANENNSVNDAIAIDNVTGDANETLTLVDNTLKDTVIEQDSNAVIDTSNNSNVDDNVAIDTVFYADKTEDKNQDTKEVETNSDLLKVADAPKRVKTRKKREIEDAMAIERYTIKDEMVESAKYLDKSRIKYKDKGTLASLKTKEIVYIVLAVIMMIVSAVIIGVIKHNNKVNEDTVFALTVVGYFLFFVVFFALAFGVDRVYNFLTLNELSTRRITLKKYGFRMDPLVLKNGRVLAIEIEGDCDMCNGENKGTYHMEWQNDELIAVCNYDRKHLYKVNLHDILDDEDNKTNETHKD